MILYSTSSLDRSQVALFSSLETKPPKQEKKPRCRSPIQSIHSTPDLLTKIRRWQLDPGHRENSFAEKSTPQQRQITGLEVLRREQRTRNRKDSADTEDRKSLAWKVSQLLTKKTTQLGEEALPHRERPLVKIFFVFWRYWTKISLQNRWADVSKQKEEIHWQFCW